MAYQWDILEEGIPKLFEDLLQSARAPLLALQSEMRGMLVKIGIPRQTANIRAKTKAWALYSSKELTLEFKV